VLPRRHLRFEHDAPGFVLRRLQHLFSFLAQPGGFPELPRQRGPDHMYHAQRLLPVGMGVLVIVSRGRSALQQCFQPIQQVKN